MLRARHLQPPFCGDVDTGVVRGDGTPILRTLHAASKFEGTGIGLSMVQRIVRHHGGEVRVRSQSGVGTVAEFTLDPPA